MILQLNLMRVSMDESKACACLKSNISRSVNTHKKYKCENYGWPTFAIVSIMHHSHVQYTAHFRNVYKVKRQMHKAYTYLVVAQDTHNGHEHSHHIWHCDRITQEQERNSDDGDSFCGTCNSICERSHMVQDGECH